MSDNKSNDPNVNDSSTDESMKSRQIQKKESLEEYRLIPISDKDYFDDDETVVDIVGLLKDLWENRRTIFTVFLIISVISAIYYLGSERMYYSETKLMPENVQQQDGLGQVFQQYQNIIGLGGGAQAGDGISIALYPDIVESLPFQIELMQQEVFFDNLGREASLFDYFYQYHEKSFLTRLGDFLWNYTIDLPSTVSGWFGGGGTPQPVNFEEYADLESPRRIDWRILEVSKDLKKYTTITREPQTDYIIIGISLPDARAAAETVRILRDMLQRYVVEYKTEKAMQDLAFIESQYEQARDSFIKAQDSLTTFQDRNIIMSTARAQAREQRLNSEFNLAFDIYNSLARRMEEAKITVQENTPVFTVQEPARIPGSFSSPNLKRVIAGSVFLGLFFGIAFVYTKRLFKKLSIEFRNRESKPYFS